MAPETSLTTLPSIFEAYFPNTSLPAQDTIPRWSELGVSHPAVVAVPRNEEEIITALRFAAENGLKVIPVGGAYSPFIPIGSQIMYLEMKRFKGISIHGASITVGGGTTNKEVIEACTVEGCYTFTGNSNAIGMIGFLLGGGLATFNGLHGIAVDHILSLRIITASGRALTLTPASTEAEGDLFSALCGAGHGLAVVVSATLPVYRFSRLHMSPSPPDDEVWVCKVMFPGSAVASAARAFLTLHDHPAPAMSARMLFMRAPPSAPSPGSPMILVAATYFGASAEAEKHAAVLFDETVVSTAVSTNTSRVPFARLNDDVEPMNTRGNLKQLANAMVRSLTSASIRDTFSMWLRFGEDTPDARARSVVLWVSWDPAKMLADGLEARHTRPFFPPKDRRAFVQTWTWYTALATREAADEFASRVLSTVRAQDVVEGVAPLTFANNQRLGGGVGEVYTLEEIESLKRVKETWDKHGLFWSPIVD
ncbi:hypothetical protein ASPZODRAFT_1377077 [Penicilliopsis zonata CBS 506.65]|uniref:FAD-binding PCMH-type domain-containing protein n=1 Tax=Penicilliopsis zonata CBS 506.65 TaxID=1073090 RepID=A0A1L9SPH1_9EURO|nr:hypothetical protein ASPZODRAFT_1377077 [Penicilliopsis zonata CBS 506.65]OJJ49016.1 hypothetical protein ASPZODRAFT_1377077 [Penicilliopsis zonata CBS 506.65]